jgi:primosomal protein N' (replication factor Y)
VGREKFPSDQHYTNFINKISRYYGIEPTALYRRIKAFIATKEKKIIAEQPLEKQAEQKITLTQEQQTVVDAIKPLITDQQYQANLIHGVTGSGKTEVYKQLISHAYQQQKSSLLMLPEVSLAVQFTHIFKQALPNIALYGFHSATGAAEKRELWQKLLSGEAVIIIGVHLPALLPIANLGLIVIDEEHDTGYQEKKHPKLNTKELLLIRAQTANIPIVLGSATPSVQSLYSVEKHGWKKFIITKRFAGAFPIVKIVKIDGKVQRKNFWITRELEKALSDRLQKKEQAIIFINRRGYSFFMQCTDCAHIFECPACSVSLTLHSDNSLRCHYCTYAIPAPTACSKCAPKKGTLIKKGIGTQQVVAILEKLFPRARIARADMDSTVNKKQWRETIDQFHNRELDILVGTQTITKGYHFPGVTLVGLLWADINLNIPFYSAAETTLQQIIQVAGRAGRQSEESLVIAQTMTDHPVFKYINEQNYETFYRYEIEHRKQLDYPPCARFAELELRHSNERIVEQESEQCADILEKNNFSELKILGPAQPPVHKIKNVFIRKIYLKSASYKTIHAAYAKLAELELQSQLFFTPNPQQ